MLLLVWPVCVFAHSLSGASHSCQCGRYCSSDKMEEVKTPDNVVTLLHFLVASRRWVYGDIELSEGIEMCKQTLQVSFPSTPLPILCSAEVAKGKRRRGWFPRQCVKVCNSSSPPSSDSRGAGGTAKPAQRRRKKPSTSPAE